MTVDELEVLRGFRRGVPLPDAQTAERVFSCATTRANRVHNERRIRMRVALVAGTLGLALVGGASAIAYHYLGSSPGFSAGISAFNQLPTASWPDSIAPVALDDAATYLGLTRAEASQRLRLLQSGLTLGPGHSHGQGSLYALVGDAGTACVFLTGQGGTCVNRASTQAYPGVLAAVLPGYPGQTPALVAIAADNVKAIALLINGTHFSDLHIVNNSVYADMKGVDARDTIALVASYSDGTTHQFTLPSLGQ